MSFYGNITNTTKTGFSFDRTYPNRHEMELNMKTDGVYIGRFILVDYDKDSENIRRAYFPINQLESVDDITQVKLYQDTSFQYTIAYNSTGIVIDENGLITGVNNGDICYVIDGTGTKIFFICDGEFYDENPDTGDKDIPSGAASFRKFKQGPDYEGIYRWNYAVNYNIDQTYFGDKFDTSIGRGWDSTVWQKVFENGSEKYVMVAELNAVIPTFTISADAPTMNPIEPHFDEVSNNTYYEIHWQPQWGMRIKHAKGLLSADEENVLSDEGTYWIQSIYNKELKLHQYYYYNTEGKWKLVAIPAKADEYEIIPIKFDDVIDYVRAQEDSEIPAAIYYNKSGFSPKTHFRSSAADNVQMTPTGYSEQPTAYEYVVLDDQHMTVAATEWKKTEYNDHQRGITAPKVDTQEWQMILPSLGNTISSIWDIIYGVGVDETGKPVYLKDEEGNIALDEAGRPIGAMDTDHNRLTYMDWVDGTDANDAPRLRMVHQTENGFTYDVRDVETLAGAINSVHDLMGMIVVDKSDLSPDDALYDQFVSQTDEDKIYFLSDGGYYRRGIGYQYTPLDYNYDIVNVTEDKYQPNFYYQVLITGDATFYLEQYNILKESYFMQYDEIRNEFEHNQELLQEKLNELKNAFEEDEQTLNTEYGISYLPDIDNEYNKDTIYAVKKINNPEEEYSLIKLNQYETNKYYYANGDNFLVETNPVARNITYYLPGEEEFFKQEEITMNFIKDEYYEKLEDGTYRPASDNIPVYDIYYSVPSIITPSATHMLENVDLYDEETETYQGRELTYFWVPGAFATKRYDEATDTVAYQLTALDAVFNPNETYYMLDWTKDINVNADTGAVEVIPEVHRAFKVKLIEFKENTYYQIISDGTTNKYTYIPATEELLKKEYADLGRERLNDPANNDEANFNKNYYYMLNPLVEYSKDNFYVSNKFHYKDENNNYLKDKNLQLTPNRIYYTLLDGAFIEVKNKFYKPNTYYYLDGVYYILDKAFVKGDKDYYEKNYFYVSSDLEGLYANGSQWNRGVEEIPCTVDLSSRKEVYEMKVLNGFARTFNTIHGLIIEINKILLSGDYDTRDRNTVQGCINLMNDMINRFQEDFAPTRLIISDNYGRLQSVPFTTNSWLDTDIIGEGTQGYVNIDHMYPYKEDNTTSQSDVNNNGDTIDLETISIDETGHIKHVNTETVTLPYGFKTVSITYNGKDEQVTNDIVADNTQDTLFIDNSNEWIEIKVDEENDTIKIGHEIHEVNKNATEIDLNNIKENQYMPSQINILSNDATDLEVLTTLNLSAEFADEEKNDVVLSWTQSIEDIVLDGIQIWHSLYSNSGYKLVEEISNVNSYDIKNDIKNATYYYKIRGFKYDENNLKVYTNWSNKVEIIKNNNIPTEDDFNYLTVIEDSFDIAGHLNGQNKTVYTLPYGFKYIETNLSDAVENYDAADLGQTGAKTTQDAIGFDAKNKWIKIGVESVDPFDNKLNRHSIGIGHEVHSIETTEKTTTDLNNLKLDTITIQDTLYDEAGHLTANQNHTYILPYGFKTFSDGVNKTTATNTQDLFTFKTDSWLITTIDAGKAVTITHDTANAATNSAGQMQDKSLTFGDTFSTVYIGIDDKGHTANLQTTTVTLPQGSLANDYNNTQAARVLTGIDFIPASGKISYSENTVGNLLLSGYLLANEVVAISEADTINQAFGKLQASINFTNELLNSKEEGLSDNILNVTNSFNEQFNAVNNTLAIINGDENTVGSIKQQINALNISDYIKKVDATGYEDILTKTEASSTYQKSSDLTDNVKAIEFNYTEEIKTLQAIIDDLKARIEILENPIVEEE